MRPMTMFNQSLSRWLGRRLPEAVAAPTPAVPTAAPTAAPTMPSPAEALVAGPSSELAIPDTDPLFAFLQSASGPVDIARLALDSAALARLRDAGIALVVPLVAQGELIGTINLGPRLSEQPYSTDDRRLVATLAVHAAPAIRVAQLVREQTAEAAERERYEQELRVAQLIQQQFLPRQLPQLEEWQVAAYYGPARVVGGDFYDFIDLGGGRIGVAVGDVTDKGVPAALIMARTHSILRAEAPRHGDPSRVLARANEQLLPEMPDRMFVTCLYGVLEPATGRFVFANAGHNLPYIRTASGIVEPRATGLPLGLLPDVTYEEAEASVGPGDELVLYSDGLVEAHNPAGEMYGYPRLRDAVAGAPGAGSDLIDKLLERLTDFTGQGWEQEDDITVVALRRFSRASGLAGSTVRDSAPLLAFSVAGEVGHERMAVDRVVQAVVPLGLPAGQLERLKTAVAETVMNAVEYGSQGKADVPVDVRVEANDTWVTVHVTDRALSGPVGEVEAPDLEAKLEGRQKARGWGLFLVRQMADDVALSYEDGLQTVTLTFALVDEEAT
jgi:serine phosphatase RsbU (regulator of sigma subunit)/anti-sigma regulatory factor (Ser/Thr protein kinase)